MQYTFISAYIITCSSDPIRMIIHNCLPTPWRIELEHCDEVVFRRNEVVESVLLENDDPIFGQHRRRPAN